MTCKKRMSPRKKGETANASNFVRNRMLWWKRWRHRKQLNATADGRERSNDYTHSPSLCCGAGRTKKTKKTATHRGELSEVARGMLVSEGSNMIGLEMSFHKKSLRKQMSLQVSYRVPGTHRITDKKHGGKIPSADPVGPSRSPMAWPSRPLRQVLF